MVNSQKLIQHIPDKASYNRAILMKFCSKTEGLKYETFKLDILILYSICIGVFFGFVINLD